MDYTTLQPQIIELINQSTRDIPSVMTGICNLLQSQVAHYDWVGFYMAHDVEPTLHLWAQAGDPTDHTVIPFGKGICGQVAVSNQIFMVDDVRCQDNYIACSIAVQSELVVPMFKNGVNIGQIDIDSHQLKAFDDHDQAFLQWVNSQVSSLF